MTPAGFCSSRRSPSGAAKAVYDADTGVVSLSGLANAATVPSSLKDDEAFVVRCTMLCQQSALPAAWSEMSAANAGKNIDGVDRANRAKIAVKVNLCN